MRKTILVVAGTANVGKSMTLAALGHHLLGNGANTVNNINHPNYRAVFQYKQRKVGLQTYGDTPPLVQEGLQYFRTQECEIIAIASKSYGGTVDAIKDFAQSNGFRVVYSGPYETWDGRSDISALKEYGAYHLRLMVDMLLSDAF